MNMEEMILEAKKLKGKDLTPDIEYGNMWESSWLDDSWHVNTYRADTPEEAVKWHITH